MKKNYELLEVKVISWNSDDVITASPASEGNWAANNDNLLGGSFDLGGLSEQTFTS